MLVPEMLAFEPTEDFIIKALVIMGVTAVILTWSVMKTIGEVSAKRATETTKREIAAYVAEGSITPEDAARIINAGSRSDAEDKIMKAVAAGAIPPNKAEKLIARIREDQAPAKA
jgi:ribosomal protein S20